MTIVLASANKGKIREIKQLLPEYEVVPYAKILGSFDIVEDGDSFQANAIIKVKAIVDKLKVIKYEKNYIVISDDSGISVPILNNEPNIYSARYAGENATDNENNQKLISKLKKQNIRKTKAFYTACLAIGYNNDIYTTHGWMHGNVIDKSIGENGFGYDPLFIPDGENDTLGVLDVEFKKKTGHRSKALKLALIVIKSLLNSNN